MQFVFHKRIINEKLRECRMKIRILCQRELLKEINSVSEKIQELFLLASPDTRTISIG